MTPQLVVTRVGFTGTERDYDGPELALQSLVRGMAEHGHEIVSVSVLRSTRWCERYEAFIVSRVDVSAPPPPQEAR